MYLVICNNKHKSFIWIWFFSSLTWKTSKICLYIFYQRHALREVNNNRIVNECQQVFQVLMALEVKSCCNIKWLLVTIDMILSCLNQLCTRWAAALQKYLVVLFKLQSYNPASLKRKVQQGPAPIQLAHSLVGLRMTACKSQIVSVLIWRECAAGQIRHYSGFGQSLNNDMAPKSELLVQIKQVMTKHIHIHTELQRC